MTHLERIQYRRAATQAMTTMAILFHLTALAFVLFGATGTAGPIPGIAWFMTGAAFYQGFMYFVAVTQARR